MMIKLETLQEKLQLSDSERQDIVAHISACLDRFSDLLYPGLEPFDLDYVLDFLLDMNMFSFALIKVRGEGVLYGLDHARLRSEIVNGLPQAFKLRVLTEKIHASGVLSREVMEAFGLSEEFHIRDITDIGMGRSIYLVDFGDKQVVFKQRTESYQTFLCELLETLDWPSFKSIPVVNDRGAWDVMTYLGAETLGDVLSAGSFTMELELQLARHAALGDILGRGDRHFQNYLVNNGNLYPIDLHYLFWADNEDWVQKYIAGGMAEFSSVLAGNPGELMLQQRKAQFFETYYETLMELAEYKATILSFIQTYFGPSPETDRKCAFVAQRLDQVDHYFTDQESRYYDALEAYKKNLEMKDQLTQLVHEDPDFLRNNPVFKMYYLADKDKLSAFFLKDDYHSSLTI